MPIRSLRVRAALAAALALWPVAGRPDRPVLEAQQGRYFRWVAPRGWRASESTNGISLLSPDGAQSAGFVLLLRSPGSSAPREFLERFLPQAPGYRALRVVSQRRLRDLPAQGGAWRMEELGVTATVNGRPQRGLFTVAVKNAWGQYDAFFSYAHADVGQWAAARQFLPQLVRGIAIVNPGQVAMSDQLLRPRNDPLDNSGLLESWRQKGLSEARISQARREGTMGYERMKDPATGRLYDMPLETYDGAAGGYRNPHRPTELLVKPRPGE